MEAVCEPVSDGSHAQTDLVSPKHPSEMHTCFIQYGILSTVSVMQPSIKDTKAADITTQGPITYCGKCKRTTIVPGSPHARVTAAAQSHVNGEWSAKSEFFLFL